MPATSTLENYTDTPYYAFNINLTGDLPTEDRSAASGNGSSESRQVARNEGLYSALEATGPASHFYVGHTGNWFDTTHHTQKNNPVASFMGESEPLDERENTADTGAANSNESAETRRNGPMGLGKLLENTIAYVPQQLTKASPQAPFVPDEFAQRVLRTHYMDEVLSDLRQIQPFCGTPEAACYADQLLHVMREFNDVATYDLYVEVVMALHDALTFENRWIDYSAQQYEAAYQLLSGLLSRNLHQDRIERAIMELEEIGFDTIPFEVSFIEE